MTPPLLEMREVGVWFDVPAEQRTVEISSRFELILSGAATACLVGRSGSGKTSLLRVAAAFTKPNEGHVQWWGRPVESLPPVELSDLRRTKIGYVDQASSLIGELSVIENVIVPALPDGRRAVREARHYAADLLAQLGLGSRARFRPDRLSGGEKQRVVIARALIMKPAIIFADEPTSNLDREWAETALELLLAQRSRGCGLIFASHDPLVVGASDTVIPIEAHGRTRDNARPEAAVASADQPLETFQET